jgi:hypothetical protein
MKKVVLTLVVALIAAGSFAQTATSKKADEFIKFKELKYDFGKIKQGTPVTHDFAFTNISGTPVIIENATASCGCTTPKWPQTPVAKGAANTITAGFNAAAAGPFNKEVYVRVKGAAVPVTITITGEVVPATVKN